MLAMDSSSAFLEGEVTTSDKSTHAAGSVPEGEGRDGGGEGGREKEMGFALDGTEEQVPAGPGGEGESARRRTVGKGKKDD